MGEENPLHDEPNNSVVAVIAPGSVPSVKTGYAYAPYGQEQATNTNSKNNLKFAGREQDYTWLYYFRGQGKRILTMLDRSEIT